MTVRRRTDGQQRRAVAFRSDSPLLSVALFFNGFSGTEQKGNAPETCERDHSVDDAAYQRILSAEDPGYEVKLEQADAAPVDGTDDHEDQGNSVHNHTALLRRLYRRSPL